MKHIKSLGKWFKTREISLLSLLVWVYIFFIPLWPKLPFKTVTYTYIALRYEDFFVALIVAVFLFDVVRHKISLKRDWILIAIPIYWLVVIFSAFINFKLFHTTESLQLALLHAFRRVEYMIIFFVGYQVIKNGRQLRLFLQGLMLVLFMVSFYGIGQKFWGWPAIQTMNPHYSKGYLLTLDAASRVSSTFGGHYDLAAFLVFLMPLSLGMLLQYKRARYFIVFATALVCLILTASRVSFIAYLVTIPVYLLSQKRFRLLAVVIALTVILTPLSDTLTKRINRTFRQELVWVSPETGKTIVARDNTSTELPAGDFVIKSGKTDLQQTPEQVMLVKREIKESIIEEAHQSGVPLTEDQINKQVEAAFNKLTPVSSILPDISFTTRLQVEWPRAIEAFLHSPIIGRGPGSITESTDNDYLRNLGETGLAGFGLLMFVILSIEWQFFQLGRKHKFLMPLFWGILFGGLALLINALYIDVFEASKVALIIWLVWGMFYKLKELPGTAMKELASLK